MHNDELYHHGIKGQRWGVRRFQDYSGQRIVGSRNYYKRSDKISAKLAKMDKGSKQYAAARVKLKKAEEQGHALEQKHAAKDYKKALNKIDQGIAEETRDYYDTKKLASAMHDKADKYKDKAERAFEKGKNAKGEKLQAKSDKVEGVAKTYDKSASEHIKNVERGRAITNSYITQAAQQGLKVSSKRTTRDVTRGSEWVLNFMSAYAGAYTGYSVMNTYKVEGRKYNVRRPK